MGEIVEKFMPATKDVDDMHGGRRNGRIKVITTFVALGMKK